MAILEEARAHLEKALEIDPSFALARFALAKLHREEGRNPEAVHLLQEAIDAQPSLTDARILLADVLLEGGKEEEAIAQLKDVAAIDANDHVSRKRLAIILAAKEEIIAAAKLFTKVVELDPMDGDAHFRLATLLEHPDDFQRAVLLLQIAADLLPEDPRPPYQMALLLLRGERTNEKGDLVVKPNIGAAHKYLQSTILLDSNHGPAHLQLGQIRQKEKDFRAAQRHYDQAIQVPSSAGFAYLQKARLARQEGKAKDVHAFLDKAIKQPASRGDALLERASVFLREKNLRKAEKDLKAAAKTFADSEIKLMDASDKASGKHNFARARRLHEEAIEARRAQGPAWSNLGQIRLTEGKVKEALQLLERALEVHPSLFDARFTLATLLEGTDRDEEALDHLEAVVTENWSHAEAHFRLGERALKDKDSQKAEMHFLIVTDLAPNHKAAKQRLRKLSKK